MKRYYLFIIAGLLSLLFFKADDKKITIKTEHYHAIEVKGNYSVTLVKGKEGEITLEGDEKSIDNTKVMTKEGVLEIGSMSKKWRSKRLLITIPIESIERLGMRGSVSLKSTAPIKEKMFSATLSGSGEASLEVHIEEAHFSISGSGDYLLTGNSNNTDMKISGSGDIKAFGLSSNHTNIQISGAGSVETSTTESLDVKIMGTGNISYKGVPKVEVKITGTGKLQKADNN